MKTKSIEVNGKKFAITVKRKSDGQDYSATNEAGREVIGGWYFGTAKQTIEHVEEELRARANQSPAAQG